MTHRRRQRNDSNSKRKEPVLEDSRQALFMHRCLLAQAELADQGEVTLGVGLLQVGQQALARVDHLQQAAAAVGVPCGEPVSPVPRAWAATISALLMSVIADFLDVESETGSAHPGACSHDASAWGEVGCSVSLTN